MSQPSTLFDILLMLEGYVSVGYRLLNHDALLTHAVASEMREGWVMDRPPKTKTCWPG